MREKNDVYYLNKLLEDMDFVIGHMDGVSLRQLEENEILLDAMLFRLIQISENAKKLTEEYRLAHKMPWKDIFGLRNRIVHDYGDVDLGVVYYTLCDDIPALRRLLAE